MSLFDDATLRGFLDVDVALVDNLAANLGVSAFKDAMRLPAATRARFGALGSKAQQALIQVKREFVVTLLDEMQPQVLARLLEVPARDLETLLRELGRERLETALGVAGDPISAQHLVKLRNRLGSVASMDDMLRSAGTQAGALQRVARVADGLEQAAARLGSVPLAAGSIVLDSNARSAIDDLLRGVKKDSTLVATFGALDPNYQQAVNAIRAQRGLPPLGASEPAPMTLDRIVGPGADLRATQVSGAEALAAATPSQVLPQMRGVQPNRAAPDYGMVIQRLRDADVGGPTGAMDRSIIADTLFAASTGTPTFVSVDKRIVVRIASAFGQPPLVVPPGMTNMAALAAAYRTGVFTANIEGHLLNVRFR
jgi:hypothetical protein